MRAFLEDDLINAKKSGGDPLAKKLMDSLKLDPNAHKRVKVEGPLVNGHLSVKQQEEVLSSMILPWIQENCGSFTSQYVEAQEALKSELEASKIREEGTAAELNDLKTQLGVLTSRLEGLEKVGGGSKEKKRVRKDKGDESGQRNVEEDMVEGWRTGKQGEMGWKRRVRVRE